MKKILLAFCFLFALNLSKAFSQMVYINQTGTMYHTKACKLYTKNFEGVELWKAKNAYGKKPCPKCKPPIKEIN